MEALLNACERLNTIYDHELAYDEFQYEFLLTGAIEDVLEEFNKIKDKDE